MARKEVLLVLREETEQQNVVAAWLDGVEWTGDATQAMQIDKGRLWQV